jgi:hypothetical protein
VMSEGGYGLDLQIRRMVFLLGLGVPVDCQNVDVQNMQCNLTL